MPDGGFDVSSMLALGAQGKLPPPMMSTAAPSPEYNTTSVHAAPDGSGAMTNLSDQDYADLMRRSSADQGKPTLAAPAAPIDVTPSPQQQPASAPQTDVASM